MMDYDEDGEETVIYYILGERAIIMRCIDSFPYKIETATSEDNVFVIDNGLISRINDSYDIDTVNENDFKSFCLSRGIESP